MKPFKPETNEEMKARVLSLALKYLKKNKTYKASKLSKMFGIPYFCFICLTDNPGIQAVYDEHPNAWGKNDFTLTYKGE